MSRTLRDTPEHAIAWVRATVLGVTLSGTLACGGAHEDQAPTCGPCCHGGGPECQQLQTQGDEDVVHDVESDDRSDDQLIEDREVVEEAPTCGPCCHGSNDPECDDF